ncbi:uncharacterized protein LOC114519634 isoform X2 [Dendronephthya gigantea]|uniref:uncharacterized protein LOC114519634 isoform X2 n=1 Tax=Dendronephthya gigantea TaxID=151771 RepID=UPI00106A84F0|nr:uncharacterized protein LOC114519634 isoform X2 [Dendronephthya gigantea]
MQFKQKKYLLFTLLINTIFFRQLRMDLNLVMLAFVIIPSLTRGVFASINKPVEVGQEVALRSRLNKGPRPTFVVWHRLGHSNKTLVAFMWRKIGSPWRTSVADNTKFAIRNDGDLVIKRMNAWLEGKYVQSYYNVTYVVYHVYIFPQNPREISTHSRPTTSLSHRSETTTTTSASKSKIQVSQGVSQVPTTTTTQGHAQTSASNAKSKAIITTPKSRLSTNKQNVTCFKNHTTEQSVNIPKKCSSSSGVSDCWKVVIGLICFAALAVI